MTAPGRATQSVSRLGAVTDDARRCCRVTAAESLCEKDPADPGAGGHWFRLGLGYQEATWPPEEGGASEVAKGARCGRQGRWSWVLWLYGYLCNMFYKNRGRHGRMNPSPISPLNHLYWTSYLNSQSLSFLLICKMRGFGLVTAKILPE